MVWAIKIERQTAMEKGRFDPSRWSEYGGYEKKGTKQRPRRLEPRKYEIFPELAEWFIFSEHCHVYPRIAAVRHGRLLVDQGYGRVQIGSYQTHDRYPPSFTNGCPVDILLETMNREGIDMANLTQAQAHGYWNDYVADCVKKWPDRFIGSACVDMDFDDLTMEELEHWNAKGLTSMNFMLHLAEPEADWTKKFPIVLGNPEFHFNAPWMDRFYEKFAEWRWTLYLDIPRRGPEEMVKSVLKELEEVMQRYPEINFIQEHFCFPSFLLWEERMRLCADYKNMFTELGCAPQCIFVLEDSRQPTAQKYLKRAIEEFDGENKILFGTDWAYGLVHCTIWQQIDWIFRQCEFLNDTQRQKILGLNAVRVHHLEEKYKKIQENKKGKKDPYFDL